MFRSCRPSVYHFKMGKSRNEINNKKISQPMAVDVHVGGTSNHIGNVQQFFLLHRLVWFDALNNHYSIYLFPNHKQNDQSWI